MAAARSGPRGLALSAVALAACSVSDAPSPDASCGFTAEWVAEGTFSPHDTRSVGSYFGVSVDVDDDTIIVGDNFQLYDFTDVGGDPGSAYVYVDSGGSWPEEAKLIPSDGEGYDRFGTSVSVSGDLALVVSSGNGRGAGYIYRRNGTSWVEEARLPIGLTADAAAIEGDTAVIGTRHVELGGVTGAAAVFVNEIGFWTQQALLVPSGPPDEGCGESVALSGDTILVGCPEWSGGDGVGVVYVFVRDRGSWTEQGSLAVEGARQFGLDLDIDGDVAIVGSYQVPSAAYIFRRIGATWTRETTLDVPPTAEVTACDPTGGWTVAISGTVALCGNDTYVFDGVSWTHRGALVTGLGGGISLAIDGDRAVVGSENAASAYRRIQ